MYMATVFRQVWLLVDILHYHKRNNFFNVLEVQCTTNLISPLYHHCFGCYKMGTNNNVVFNVGKRLEWSNKEYSTTINWLDR